MNQDFLKKVLQMKEMDLDEFFNLDYCPIHPDKKIDFLVHQFNVVTNHLKVAGEQYKKQENTFPDIRSAQAHNQHVGQTIKELEIVLDEYKFAYNSLCELLHRMVDEEGIDLRKYTGNISDAEWKKVTRGKRIKGILGDLDNL